MSAEIIKDKWVSVKKRLPDARNKMPVMVIDKYGDIDFDSYDFNGRHDHNNWYKISHITHWQPLPAPPNQKKHE